MVREGVEWIQLARDRVWWYAVVSLLMNSGFEGGKKSEHFPIS